HHQRDDASRINATAQKSAQWHISDHSLCDCFLEARYQLLFKFSRRKARFLNQWRAPVSLDLQGTVGFTEQEMGRGKLKNAREGREWAGHILVCQVRVDRRQIRCDADLRVGSDGFYL